MKVFSLLVVTIVSLLALASAFKLVGKQKVVHCHPLLQPIAYQSSQKKYGFLHDTLGISRHAQVLPNDTNKPVNPLKKLWQSTVGLFFAFVVSSFRRLFGKEKKNTSSEESREETVASLKAIALQDRVDEKVNGAQDNVILVNTAPLSSPLAGEGVEVESEEVQGAALSETISKATPIELSEEELAAARKTVELKLKELGEKRQQGKASPLSPADLSVKTEDTPALASTSSSPAPAPAPVLVATSSSLSYATTGEGGLSDRYATTSPSSLEEALAPVKEVVAQLRSLQPFSLSSLQAAFSPSSPDSPSDSPPSLSSPSFSLSSSVDMSQIKALGRAGVLSYVLTEVAFWLLTPLPLLLAPHSPDSPSLLAYSAVVLGGARVALPLRFSLAVALTPYVRNLLEEREEEGGAERDGVERVE